MTPVAVGAVGLLILLILLALRVPIAIALAGVSVVGVGVIRGPHAAFAVLAEQPYNFIAHWTLSAIPMFLLMGSIAYHAGLTESLYKAARLWLLRLPGGLAVASTMACAGFAAASGSSIATSAAMGRIAIPEMLKYRYDPGIATGSVAVAGTLGSLIPPSILMVLYAIFAEVSVSRALLAGILPGLLSALMFTLLIVARCWLNPKLAPVAADERVSWRDRFSSLLEIWPLPVLVLAVIGTMYSGVFTATEAAAGGAFMITLIAALRRQLTPHIFLQSVFDALKGTATILFIAMGGFLLSRFMAFSGLPFYLSELVEAMSVNWIVFMLGISLIYIVLGMFLDSIGIMLLTIPILLPVMASMNMDLIWFGVILIKYLEIGLVTPPVGLNCFIIKSVVGDTVPLEKIFKGVMWFIAADLVTLALLIAFPDIALFIPNLLK
ncbi:TRAP transporter large permease [Pseudohoeflea coraliihabitans]|uniref:TRAP transporter large permease protein n=1 Tax=Pseudohoeflea coraliihabitans TaxID=2860393 RepID=A0ABS6WIQ6_9HYPH|nr:TRAP transporter large permease [Pseudohoeflea sp. DP4N28-3]MBW3095818.1 TRAP transporter large permease [Pseudohoeflea sp. DP4N28-3]